MVVAEGVTVTAGVGDPAGVVTVTTADWAEGTYPMALEESGTYAAVSVSLPIESVPAARLKVAEPATRVCCAL
jgi:hypothetical protein